MVEAAETDEDDAKLNTPIGLAGLGRMGSAMARRLVGAGHEIVVFNRTRATADALGAALECGVAPDPAALAERCEIIIVMVGDSQAAEDLFFGESGLVHGFRSGSLAVVMSTLGPDAMIALARRAAPTGARLLDAPVSGTPASVEAGDLLVLAGGDAEDVARSEPVLRSFSHSVRHLGPLGAGSTMKLIVNSLVFALAESLAEGVTLAERCGIEPAAAYDVILDSAVSCAMMRHRRELFVHPGSAPVAFRLVLANKDLRLIEDLAARVDAVLPQVALNRALTEDAIAAGFAEEDLASLALWLRGRSRSEPATG